MLHHTWPTLYRIKHNRVRSDGTVEDMLREERIHYENFLACESSWITTVIFRHLKTILLGISTGHGVRSDCGEIRRRTTLHSNMRTCTSSLKVRTG